LKTKKYGLINSVVIPGMTSVGYNMLEVFLTLYVFGIIKLVGIGIVG
tara:strand:- start:265 stop:405 length:141 start_codon:yes stop_codon:yes gene_type:complete